MTDIHKEYINSKLITFLRINSNALPRSDSYHSAAYILNLECDILLKYEKSQEKNSCWNNIHSV